MKRLVLGVDVDLTVVNPVHLWFDWYKDLTGHDIVEDIGEKTFNIEEIMHRHHSPMDFWKRPDLYDKLDPIENSVEVLTKLSESYDIVFISHCLPEHEMSKRYFVQRNFKFDHGFVSTGDKGYVKCDVFVDDYHKYLQKVQDRNPECLCLMHESFLNKSYDGDFQRVSWEDIERML